MKIKVITGLLKQLKNRKTLIILICTFVTLSSIASIAYAQAAGDKIYHDVYINDINAGNLTKPELASLLKDNHKDEPHNTGITLVYKSYTMDLSYEDIDVKYDIKEVVEKAYSHGRDGSILNKLVHVLPVQNSKMVINFPVSFDKEKIDEVIDSFEKKSLRKVKDAELLFDNEKIVLRSGIAGEVIDRNKLKGEIKSIISQCIDKSIEVPIINVNPQKINVDDIFTRLNRDPSDAYITIQDNKAIVASDINGISIDRNVLADIISEVEKKDGLERILPVVFKEPDLTKEEIEKMLFRDVMSTFSTQFSTDTENNINRRDNIILAISKINGTVLAPGETFSFNEIVGERTKETGYKEALSFIGGKVVPSTGGGICQVSTTLFNAFLPLGFEIEERRNHMFTVSYVPLGMDAAVAYGILDLKFKNTSSWPVKIEGKVTKDNKIYFSIIGTIQDENKSFEHYSEILKTVNNKIKYIDKPDMSDGKTVVRQQGSNGYVVDTYRIVKENGKIVSKQKIYTSVYSPLDKEILRGTKKVYISELSKD